MAFLLGYNFSKLSTLHDSLSHPMKDKQAEQALTEVLVDDPFRMEVLECLQSVFPQGYVAAGFLRNLVWDKLHGKNTQLNDIDVIYFDKAQSTKAQDIQRALHRAIPLPWQVKNQASMHQRNGDPAYLNLTDAMRHWPEKETAVAVKLSRQPQQFEFISAFGLSRLFCLSVTPNPLRDKDVFNARVNSKQWLTHWPNLHISSD
jgi:hypothetical protein